MPLGLPFHILLGHTPSAVESSLAFQEVQWNPVGVVTPRLGHSYSASPGLQMLRILVGTESIWWLEIDVAQYDVKSAVIIDDYQH